ncbi:LOW QUALITY PROTEIN: globoside alpha-1,3-N-acetylgalactosaminyltransferase 1 [Thomomys bottae]
MGVGAPSALHPRPTELLTLTPWLAPTVSEGTFNPELRQHLYQLLNLTAGITVFAVGKWSGKVLQHVLESAEEFVLRGFWVHYYVFTSSPTAVPGVWLGPGRRLSVASTQGHSQWEEVSMRRMEAISHIARRAHREAHYLFCFHVNMTFRNPWGPETLGDMMAAIHPGYFSTLQQFPYELRQASAAFVADSEGDFYYGGVVFGGRVANVYEFTRGCHLDTGIMAVWQEESHLNRRFVLHKPSKVLSEYLWDNRRLQTPSLKLIRFSTLDKDPSVPRS